MLKSTQVDQQVHTHPRKVNQLLGTQGKYRQYGAKQHYHAPCLCTHIQSNCSKIQEVNNTIIIKLPIMEIHLNHAMQNWKEKHKGILATIVSTINLNTNHQVELATNKITAQTTNLHVIIGTLAYEIQLSNQHMQGIVQDLTAQYPEILQHPPPLEALSTSMHTTTSPLQLHLPMELPPIHLTIRPKLELLQWIGSSRAQLPSLVPRVDHIVVT